MSTKLTFHNAMTDLIKDEIMLTPKEDRKDATVGIRKSLLSALGRIFVMEVMDMSDEDKKSETSRTDLLESYADELVAQVGAAFSAYADPKATADAEAAQASKIVVAPEGSTNV